MLDPITVIATASAAYNALKKGIEIGRELQDMSGQLAAWAGAVSDLDFLAKKAEAPVWWRAGSNVQAEAMEIFAAKKKIASTERRAQDVRPVLLRSVRVGGVAPD
jgi:prophage DNA circulation protein